MQRYRTMKIVDKFLFITVLFFECNSSLATYDILQYGFLILLAISLITEKRFTINLLVLSMAMFGFWSLLSVVWSVDIYRTFTSTIMVMKWLFLLFYMDNKGFDLDFLLTGFGTVNFVNALLLLPNIDYRASFAGKRGHHILWGVEWSVNETADMFAIAIIFLFFILLTRKGPVRKMTIFMMMSVLMTDILLMGSRQGALVAFCGCSLMYLLSYNIDNIVKNLILFMPVFIVALVIACWYIFHNEVLYSTFGQRISGSLETSESDMFRFHLIKVGLNIFQNRPLIGYGTDSYYMVSGKLSAYAHNNYIELLVDTGLIGFFLYHAGYMYFFLNKNKCKGRKKKALSYSCVFSGLLFEMVIVTFPLFVYQILIWLPYMIISEDNKRKSIIENGESNNGLRIGILRDPRKWKNDHM